MIQNIALTFLFGVLVTVHISMNARVGALSGSAILANAVFWVLGAVVAVAFAAIKLGAAALGAAALEGLGRVPPVLFLAGVLGSGIALFNTWMIPRVGIASFSLLIILGQLVAAALLGRTGFLASTIEPMGALRLAGLVAVAAGSALFFFGK